MDSKTRCIEALEIIADTYDVNGDLESLREANNWQPGAVVMLAEALAALVLEVKPRSAGGEPVRTC